MNKEIMSSVEMKLKIMETMRDLMWVALGVVVMSREDKVELANRADQLVKKFQHDFVLLKQKEKKIC